MERLYLTKKEAIEFSGIRRLNLDRYINNGKLAHYKPESEILIRKDDLIEFMERPHPGRLQFFVEQIIMYAPDLSQEQRDMLRDMLGRRFR